MPRVPTLEGQSVQQRALGNVRVDPNLASVESFGGGPNRVNQASQQLLAVADKIHREETAKANYFVQTENKRIIDEWDLKNRFNAKTGAVAKKGKDAFSVPEDLSNSFDELVSQRSKELATDEQRFEFSRLAEGRRADVNKWAQQHVGAEKINFENEEYLSTLESSKEIAITSPGSLQRENITIKQQVLNMAELRGWGKEKTKQELQKHTTDLHGRMVSKLMADGNDLGAKAYFDQIKKEIDPDVRTKIANSLKESTLRGESQRQADKIVIGNAGSLGDALDKARSIKDPDLRDRTVQRVKQQFADNKAVKDFQEKQTYEVASALVEKTKSIDSIPVEQWNTFSESKKKSLIAWKDLLRKGKDPITDQDLFYDMQLMAANPKTRSDFAKVNLTEKKHKLSRADFNKLTNLQAGIIKGDDKTKEGLSTFLTNTQIVNAALNRAGITNEKKNKAKIAQFQVTIDQEVSQFQQQAGRKIKRDELQDMMDQLLIKGDSNGDSWFGGKDKFVFELKEGETFIPFSEQATRVPVARAVPTSIPEEDRKQIVNALIKKGKAVTEENIRSLYHAAGSQGRVSAK